MEVKVETGTGTDVYEQAAQHAVDASPAVDVDEQANEAAKQHILRCRMLGGGFVWAVILDMRRVSTGHAIQAISKGEAIKAAKREIGGTFIVETVR